MVFGFFDDKSKADLTLKKVSGSNASAVTVPAGETRIVDYYTGYDDAWMDYEAIGAPQVDWGGNIKKGLCLASVNAYIQRVGGYIQTTNYRACLQVVFYNATSAAITIPANTVTLTALFAKKLLIEEA